MNILLDFYDLPCDNQQDSTSGTFLLSTSDDLNDRIQRHTSSSHTFCSK